MEQTRVREILRVESIGKFGMGTELIISRKIEHGEDTVREHGSLATVRKSIESISIGESRINTRVSS
jgi:hypothetical protein